MLGNWLSEAISSRTKTKVVRLLSTFPTKEFTGREIAGAIGVGHRAVDLALGDLVALDIVTIRRIGRANVYAANGDSHHFRTLAALFDEEAGTKDALMGEIREAVSGVLSCVMFGSVARGDEQLHSDVDLLIVTDDPRGLREALKTLVSNVARKFSMRVAPIVLTPRQLRRKWKAPYVMSAAKEGVLIAGESLEGILAKTR